MAKDTFFLDCDGKLHLLRIDRPETACEGSNDALLMLSMLLQKNAEIVHFTKFLKLRGWHSYAWVF